MASPNLHPILSADLDGLAITAQRLADTLDEAQTIFSATLRVGTESARAIRGAASEAWAELLDNWHAQAAAQKAKGGQLADGTAYAAKTYAATDSGCADDLDAVQPRASGAASTARTAGAVPQGLYGPSGSPSQDDVHQSGVGDCFFDASMAAVAKTQPDTIKKMIGYDPKTGNYAVKLFDYADGRDWAPGTSQDHPWPVDGKTADGRTVYPVTPKTITVTPADLKADQDAQGVNSDTSGAPKWPVVVEAAWAKMLDSDYGDWIHGKGDAPDIDPKTNPSATGLTFDQRYKDPVTAGLKIAESGNGGEANQGLATLTGHTGAYADASMSSYDKIKAALDAGQPVEMGTTGAPDGDREFQDGLAHDHEYTVEKIDKGADGSVRLTVRNPWGNNDGIPGDENTQGGYVTVDLGSELNDKVIDYFDIGSAEEPGAA